MDSMLAEPNICSDFLGMLLSIVYVFADSLNIRRLLLFSGVTVTVPLLGLRFIHLRLYASPDLIPVSLRS